MRMGGVIRLLLLVVVASLSTGCATLFTGTTKSVMVTSNPPGAEVLLNGQLKGQTPVRVDYSGTQKDVRLEVRKQGYAPQQVLATRTLETLAVLNCVNLLCWGVDALTGAMWRFEPGEITVNLAPMQGVVPSGGGGGGQMSPYLKPDDPPLSPH